MPAVPLGPTGGLPRPFLPGKPVVIGLCGGVAAGKSAVASMFAAHGLCTVDADQLARAVAAEPVVLQAIVAEFGATLVKNGALDRAAMAHRVFADPGARGRLEAILHPLILVRIRADLAAKKAAGTSVLLDAPLLLETGLDALCDRVVFVAASPAVRSRRAAARGWDAAELARREAAQRPLADKAARADHVIDNDGSLHATAAQVGNLLDALAAAPA